LIRTHQAQFERACDAIIAGSPARRIILHVSPGGGKSAIPIIAGRLITAGLADALCWVTPRKALQDQGERNFLDPFFRSMFDHKLTVRSSTNEINPCRGQSGFVTTYQAIGVDENRTVLRDFSTKRYILILDEFHHVEDGGVWHKALAPLVDRAKYLILMTGTLARGDDKKIAFIPYRQVGKESYAPDIDGDDNETFFIRYSRTTALIERAIIPIRFILSDGHVEWETRSGEKKAGRLSRMYQDQGASLFTALNTGFAEALLDRGLEHWQRWKRYRPSSKLMVVTANYEHAKAFTAILREKGFRAKIATSHESPTAMKNIKEFKFKDLDILACIAMCYEGLDVPQISHIISLTRVRSVPWIEQMISRAVRIDPSAGPYESQVAHVFAPDDPLFSQVVQKIRAEQIPIAIKGEPKGKKEGFEETEGDLEPWITPINGEIAGSRVVSFYGDGIPTGEIPPIIQTVTDLEGEMRLQIENHVSRYSFENYYRPEKINGEIKGRCGKSRGDMTLKELEECLAYVEKAYPLNGGPGHGASKPRGKGRRVPSKAYTWEGR